MSILNKSNIKKALQHPFSFIIIFLLAILALANSFAVGCLIAALGGTLLSLISMSPNLLISQACGDSSWKFKGITLLSNILGRHTILIIIVGIILWLLLNRTDAGRKLLHYLD